MTTLTVTVICDRGDVVRVGLCQPLDVKGYDIVLEYPVYRNNNVTWADNLDELDKDTTGDVFFHDKVNGYRLCLAFSCACILTYYLLSSGG